MRSKRNKIARPSSFVFRPLLPSVLSPQSSVLIISILALALGVWCLDCYGLWYDEVASVEIARRGPVAIITDRFGGMLVQTPLHYLMVWLMALPIDPASTPVLVRLPSVIAGALTPMVVYGIGKEMFGHAQGLLAALFVAISAVHIGYSQDVRPYSLLIFATALSVYSLLRAERDGSRKWWAAFAISTVFAMYISYFSLTLFLPALIPYLFWLLWKLWSRRGTNRLSLMNGLLAMLGIAILAIPIALDVLRLLRNPPDLGLLTPRLLLDQGTLLLTRTTQIGLGGEIETYAQWGLFLLALIGIYSAIRARRFGPLALCVLIIVIPALLLAIARTTNQVFQRYAVFVMPFYFLLIANGIMRFWILDFGFWIKKTKLEDKSLVDKSKIQNPKSKISAILGMMVALLFIAGLLIYISPEGHRRFSYMPDYRGAAQYLSSVAGPGDLIIMADEPALGVEVVHFYWRGVPPAPTFDARDPRLFAQQSEGTIFWVVSFFQNNPEFIRDLPSSDPAWSDPTYFERIVIVRDSRHSALPGMERLATRAEEKLPEFQPVRTLQGVLYQARGETVQAADQYGQAGAYFPQLGAEFFSSAQGFEARGDTDKAWREAITSKFMQPSNPDLHAWLSQQLLTSGFTAESLIEAEIAEALRR
ncbi:MAG TPA: glycosyltransferase family 39 protein [Chloroflexia bacterium]|nr:glycosyltransferase family 39 protein [Chloroflexia bacterium]